jgi:hypothetical protein
MRLPSSQRNVVELEAITTTSDDDLPTSTPSSSAEILLKTTTTFDTLQMPEDITAPARWHKETPSGIIERTRSAKASRKDYTEVSQNSDELYESEDSTAKLKKQKIILHDGIGENRPERSLALEVGNSGKWRKCLMVTKWEINSLYLSCDTPPWLREEKKSKSKDNSKARKRLAFLISYAWIYFSLKIFLMDWYSSLIGNADSANFCCGFNDYRLAFGSRSSECFIKTFGR